MMKGDTGRDAGFWDNTIYRQLLSFPLKTLRKREEYIAFYQITNKYFWVWEKGPTSEGNSKKSKIIVYLFFSFLLFVQNWSCGEFSQEVVCSFSVIFIIFTMNSDQRHKQENRPSRSSNHDWCLLDTAVHCSIRFVVFIIIISTFLFLRLGMLQRKKTDMGDIALKGGGGGQVNPYLL